MNDTLRFAAAAAVAIGFAAGCDMAPPDNDEPHDLEIRMEDGGVPDLTPPGPDTAGPDPRWAPADLENPPVP